MKSFIPFLIVLAIGAGCARVQDTRFPEVQDNRKAITVHQLNMDTLPLPAIECSYVGHLSIRCDSIYFVDEKFCWVFSFGKDGSAGARYFGKGNGPKEIAAGVIAGHALLNNGDYFFIGFGHDCYIYNQNQTLKKRYRLDIGIPEQNLTYDDPASYMLNYDKLMMREFNGYLYYTVHIEKEGLWYYDNPQGSWQNEHILAKMNLDNGKVEGLLGWHSPFCEPSKGLIHMFYPFFDMDKQGGFYIGYEVDPLIYAYDKNFTPLLAFGHEGQRMNKKYSSSAVRSDYRAAWRTDRVKCGYYTGLEYIDEIGLLLRTYTRGEKEPDDGLQIYKNGVLIGDVDVPKGMTIIGYIEPFVYGAAINEDNEEINVYRFIL